MKDFINIYVIISLIAAIAASIYIIILKNKNRNLFETLKKNHQYIIDLENSSNAKIKDAEDSSNARIEEAISSSNARIEEILASSNAQVDEIISDSDARVNESISKSNAQIDDIIDKSNNRINEIMTKFLEYRRKVDKNFRKTFSVGEIKLIEIFRELLVKPEFFDYSIYGHLNIRGDLLNDYQADFLIVSDKGVFLIESKMWNGVTFVYSGDDPEIFVGTSFKDYGKEPNTGVTVFNICNKAEGEGLVINKYTNPVSQARQYSLLLKNIIHTRVLNFVVFQKDDCCKVKFNNQDLDYCFIDKYTCITTQEYLPTLLHEINTKADFDPYELDCMIQTKFQYEIFLSVNNADEPPWGGE